MLYTYQTHCQLTSGESQNKWQKKLIKSRKNIYSTSRCVFIETGKNDTLDFGFSSGRLGEFLK